MSAAPFTGFIILATLRWLKKSQVNSELIRGSACEVPVGEPLTVEAAVDPAESLIDRLSAALRLAPDHVVFKGAATVRAKEIVRNSGISWSERADSITAERTP